MILYDLIIKLPGTLAGDTKGVVPTLATNLAGVFACTAGGAAIKYINYGLIKGRKKL